MFVSKEAIPITLDNENFIFIKQKLNFGEKMRVQKAALRIEATGAKSEFKTEYDAAAYQTQLLLESIVRWHGPAFENRACNAANIAELDPTDPLLDKVIAEVSERNKTKSDDPKASAGGGETPSVDISSLPSANGTSTSASP